MEVNNFKTQQSIDVAASYPSFFISINLFLSKVLGKLTSKGNKLI